MEQLNLGKNVVVIGTQWGDEGKGKVVDWLTDHAHGVVRFQGGHNAGHTLIIGGKKTIFPADTGMKHPQNQVGIFMAPTLERSVKTVHPLKVCAPQAHIATSYAMPTKIRFDPRARIRRAQ